MKKLSILLLILCGIVVLDACQKPGEIIQNDQNLSSGSGRLPIQEYIDQSVHGDYEVRDGMFYFKSAKTFFVLDSSLRTKSFDDRIKFTKGLGFTSLLDAQLTTTDLLNKADSKEKYDEIITKNNDILRQVGDNLNPVFERISAAILNREGMVSIGGKIHCFVKTKTIIGNTVDEVREAYKTGTKLSENVIMLATNGDKNAGAKVLASCQKFDNTVTNSEGNRRVHTEVDVLRRTILTGYDGDNLYQVEFYADVIGIPYTKNWLGSWVGYSTGNTLYSRFDISITVAQEYFGAIMYVTTYYTVNESPYSNTGSLIEFIQVEKTYYNIRQFYISTGYYSFTKNLTEASTLGLYTSGGVPGGVTMKCP